MSDTAIDVEGQEMTLVEHLTELRMRIVRSALAIAIGAVLVGVVFYDEILSWLLHPYAQLCRSSARGYCGDSYNAITDQVALFALDPLEGISTRLKIASYGGLVLALPVVLWQLWKFIVPALHKNEKRYAAGFVLSTTLLFSLGGVIAFTTLERALQFLIEWAGDDVLPQYQVGKYISLVTLMIISFGVGFTLPVLLVFLQLMGVVQWRTLLRAWRYAIVGTFVVAAAITPSGDPWSLLSLSVPLIFFYFTAVFIGWLIQRRRPDN